MRGIYNSLGYMREYYPELVYFVHDSRRDGPDNNPLRSPNHFLVYFGDPHGNNREWAPSYLGLTLQEAVAICNRYNTYPHDLAGEDLVKIVKPGDDYDGWICEVYRIQYSGTVVVKSLPNPEIDIEFVNYYHPAELMPYTPPSPPTQEELYFSSFV